MDRINILLVAVGGMTGSVARYLTAYYTGRLVHATYPYGTLAANVIGCFAIGLIYGLAARYQWFTPAWRIFLATGFCGGYTTFSSFAFENVQMLEQGSYLTFFSYAFGSLALGLLSVFAGLMLCRL